MVERLGTDRVIRVGAGSGFVVQGAGSRFVITAGHCLPHFPPCASFSYLEERTYAKLLGPLRSRPTVWAECLFVNPIADIAVLGSPDNQELFGEAEAYEMLVGNVVPLRVSELPQTDWDFHQLHARLLSLDCQWFKCKLNYRDNSPLWIFDAAQDIRAEACPVHQFFHRQAQPLALCVALVEAPVTTGRAARIRCSLGTYHGGS